MSDFEKLPRNKVRRVPDRAHYDKATIYQIVDEALICHVGFVQEGQPFVIPTIHARVDDHLILHGAPASRLLKHVEGDHEICVTITLLDGLVMARSVFHHSMNYRSVLLFGKGQLVNDRQEKLGYMEVLTNHIMPGRWDDARRPNEKEMKATTLVILAIDSASAKVRTGQPVDDEEDYQLPVWAGVLPLSQQVMEPIDDPRLEHEIPIPGYIRNYHRRSKISASEF
jgi:nitroimidazol reductase NimA-like FMN-containing flavoprotein (pyridoxamine 5'-phosphate oxidase superfamily)